ncbi:factor-independent urate hydroxylase [Tundrisphaera sp. TA3]|uniref:factor-independent urate hydroxylase n=1 Tax=Tundrisphaera sp. TA3 TaxID=3435775 RepID=UPI003EB922A9
MPVALTHNAYGTSRVRLTKLERGPDRHEIRDVVVDLRLEGNFEASFTEGDNAQVIATDTMKNLVYALAVGRQLGSIEEFGAILLGHLLGEYSDVGLAEVRISEEPWRRIAVDGQNHPHAFVGGGREVRTAVVSQSRDQERRVASGIEGLMLLKTEGSASTGFSRDGFAVLPEPDERILATEVRAEWTYSARSTALDYDGLHRLARDMMVRAFATHESRSIQQTLHALGESVLDAIDPIEEIRITLPNKHRIPFDVSRFGLDGRDEIFVATDEPYGVISGTLRRA